MGNIIEQLIKEQKSSKEKYIPGFRAGDTVRVHVKIKEGDNERVQSFEGIVIKKRGGGTSMTFTVRKVSFGVGIERTFFAFSPVIEKIEQVHAGRVRRSKLYFLRALKGKAAKIDKKVKEFAPVTSVSSEKATQPVATSV